MRETCEGQLTYSECFKVLSTFSNDKTPGNDGLTIEFYKFFWSEIGTFLVDSLNYAYFHSPLQKREGTGKEYGCFPFVLKTKTFK